MAGATGRFPPPRLVSATQPGSAVVTDFEPAVRRIVGEVRDELNTAAPPNATTVTLHVILGDPEPDQWCPACLLPSAFLVDLHGLHRHGMVALGRLWACADCGLMERCG